MASTRTITNVTPGTNLHFWDITYSDGTTDLDTYSGDLPAEAIELLWDRHKG